MRERAIKGKHCLGLGALFTFTALILLIFVHVGQVNPGKVPSSISMVYMNVSALGAALQSATGDPSTGLYNTDNRTIGMNQGLQYIYLWGLYSVCGYYYNATFDGGGGCTNTTIANAFTPFNAILEDVPPRYNTVNFFISNSGGVDTFTNSGYFTTFTHAAYYLILIATIATAVALIVGLWRYTATFVISTILVVLSAIFLLAASILWETVIRQAKSINDARSGSNNIPVGITLQQGNAPYMLWAAFALLVASIIPYGISCCTYRRY